jgi:hypothetical protein
MSIYRHYKFLSLPAFDRDHFIKIHVTYHVIEGFKYLEIFWVFVVYVFNKMSDFEAEPEILAYFEGVAEAWTTQENTPVKRESKITSFFTVSKTTSDNRRWFGKPRKLREPREPRRARQGEWDSERSDDDNVQRLRRNRLANSRRRAKRESSPLPQRGDSDESLRLESSSVDHRRAKGVRRNRVVLSAPPESVGNRGGPPGFSAVDKFDRRRRVRRQGRSATPEWLEVPAEDRHKYAKLVSGDSGYVALKEWTLRRFESEMSDEELCGVCPGQHAVADCPRLEGFQGTPRKRKSRDLVDMGELFSFMGNKRRRLN